MQMRIQSSNWSCLPTAFAMAIDVEPRAITNILEHDGSEILFPESDGLSKRRGFHIQEMYEACYVLGHIVMPYHFELHLGSRGVVKAVTHPKKIKLLRLTLVIVGVKKDTGVLHSVAWCPKEQKIFNPQGSKHDNPMDVFEEMTECYIVEPRRKD